MNIFKKLFGKKTNRALEDEPVQIHKPNTVNVIRRNSKGQFVEGIGGLDHIKRDSVTGQFKSKKPHWEAPRD